jgi:cephalosporin hydroxylase
MPIVAQIESEINKLTDIIKPLKPATLLEIGTWKGGTLYHFSRVALFDSTVISIDAVPYPISPTCFKYRRCQNIHLLIGDTHQTKTFTKIAWTLEDKPLEFLFIDGDHSYRGVRDDFNTYSSLMENGIIALHDITTHPKSTGCEVEKFWKEIKVEYESYEFIESVNQQWGGIGVIIKGKVPLACRE